MARRFLHMLTGQQYIECNVTDYSRRSFRLQNVCLFYTVLSSYYPVFLFFFFVSSLLLLAGLSSFFLSYQRDCKKKKRGKRECSHPPKIDQVSVQVGGLLLLERAQQKLRTFGRGKKKIETIKPRNKTGERKTVVFLFHCVTRLVHTIFFLLLFVSFLYSNRLFFFFW